MAYHTADPVALLQQLIRCPSVTPEEGGALDLVQDFLSGRGFTCTRLPAGQGTDAPSDNLYARLGSQSGDNAPHFCFAGHTDVVPPGSAEDWRFGPFSGEIADDCIWGRGAVDMKGGIACFMAAVDRFLADSPDFDGSLSFLITGDEEGPALHGTTAVVDWMSANNEVPDLCIVGEPTNPDQLTDAIKVGRRGSMTSYITVTGTQGHSAYPHLANNPVHGMIDLLALLTGATLDDGSEHFPPSNLEVVSVDVGNPANNVIPAQATAVVNIRFNDHHSSETLTAQIDSAAADVASSRDLSVTVRHKVSGESFVFEPGRLAGRLADVVERTLGKRPEYSTSGGTSDARFIKALCPVAEYGLVGQTMHKVDEHARITDVRSLTDVYYAFLNDLFGRG